MSKDVFRWFSWRHIGSQDTKTIIVNWREKKVVITLQEKKDELRKILYPELEKHKNIKSMTTQKIIQTLKIEELIQEKYPKTDPLAQGIIIKWLIEKITRKKK